MHKIGWFTLGIIVALSVSTIADEGETPDESQLRDLAASAEMSVKFETNCKTLSKML